MSADASQRPLIRIEVVSDVVCPWCYVAKRRLEKAMKKFQCDFEVLWLPHQLNPTAPEAFDKIQMFNQRFGLVRAQKMVPFLEHAFQVEGLKFSIEGKTGNTFTAHRLMTWAGATAGLPSQDRLIEALFRRYFAPGGCINDPQLLASAAEEAGLPRDQALAIVSDPSAYATETQRLLDKYQDVSGVPHFIIGKEEMRGPQPHEVFEQIFEDMLQLPKPEDLLIDSLLEEDDDEL